LLPTVAAAADPLETRANQITQQIATTFGLLTPDRGPAGVAYRFDPVTGNFQREAAIAGRCS
jgi:hypothetical protein